MGANLAYATLVGMLTARRLGFVAAVSAAALTVVALSFGSFNLGGAWSGYGGGWLRVCWGFTAGILVYRFCLRHPPKPLPTVALYALGLGFVGLSAIRSEGVALDLGAVLIAFPLAVYFGAGVELSGVSKRLASRLGHLSYPVYITHSPILDVLLKPLAGKLGFRMGSHPNTAVVVCGLLAVAAAWALDVFFDRPVRAWLTRRLTSHESRLSPSVDSGSPA
jgi:peptidoglycan/LPS O-acetylase OafA/YrhL